ncbi:unnamed protein product [Ectocarpus sp. 12 AP-2014]
MYPPGMRIVARRLFLTALILWGVPAWSVGMSMQTPEQDLARTTAASPPETAVIHSSLRDIAAGTSLTATGSSSSGKNTWRHPLGSVDLIATPHPNSVARKFELIQKFRFKANVNKRVDKVLKECQKAARAFGKLVRDFRTLAFKSVVSHFGGRLIEQDPSPASTRNDKPVEAIREIWANTNQPHVVATEPGYKARRTILGAVASNDMTCSTACEFVGGSLSRATFNEAKARRETALADVDMSKLSGKRKKRSD